MRSAGGADALGAVVQDPVKAEEERELGNKMFKEAKVRAVWLIVAQNAHALADVPTRLYSIPRQCITTARRSSATRATTARTAIAPRATPSSPVRCAT